MTSYSKDAQLGRRMLTVDDYKITTKNEDELQDKCEAWLKEQRIWYVHIPQAAYKARRAKHALKGIPDLLVFLPNDKDKFNRAVLFELKSRTGESRAGQKLVARQVNVFQIKSYLAFLDIMQDFLKEVA
jgi:hypothetical protein